MDIALSDLVTVGLLIALEGLLSADNAMVLAVLVLGLPKKDQRKALRYGIVGAFGFRVVALVGTPTIEPAPKQAISTPYPKEPASNSSTSELAGACHRTHATCAPRGDRGRRHVHV